MKIALLGNANALHTLRWANALSAHDIELHLISAHPFSESLSPAIVQHRITPRAPWGYVLGTKALRRILDDIKPDVLNAHYASGYGTLGASAGFHPFVQSVWGSDVFDFPKRSAAHRRLIQRNLAAADCVCSISHVMADQCHDLVPHLDDVRVVSWGVDTQAFRPDPAAALDRQGAITIGTVKVLAPKYGVDTLIEGFAELRRRVSSSHPETAQKLKLRLVGDGPQRAELERLAEKCGVGDVTAFVGAVPHDTVPDELSKLDIYVAVSRFDSESFGVAILEAAACERPVVVSDAGGLPEVVADGETGFVVPRENPQRLADCLEQLALDSSLRSRLGGAGRSRVLKHYEWNNDVRRMLSLYRSLTPGHATSMARVA